MESSLSDQLDRDFDCLGEFRVKLPEKSSISSTQWSAGPFDSRTAEAAFTFCNMEEGGVKSERSA